MENTKKITKAMRFADIRALLAGEDVTYGTTVEDAVAFIDYEVSLLSKKNSAKSKKATAETEQNNVYRGLIVDFLQGCEAGVTCTEILKGIPELADAGYGNQKIAALLRPMLAEGAVVKTSAKGRSLFALA